MKWLRWWFHLRLRGEGKHSISCSHYGSAVIQGVVNFKIVVAPGYVQLKSYKVIHANSIRPDNGNGDLRAGFHLAGRRCDRIAANAIT